MTRRRQRITQIGIVVCVGLARNQHVDAIAARGDQRHQPERNGAQCAIDRSADVALLDGQHRVRRPRQGSRSESRIRLRGTLRVPDRAVGRYVEDPGVGDVEQYLGASGVYPVHAWALNLAAHQVQVLRDDQTAGTVRAHSQRAAQEATPEGAEKAALHRIPRPPRAAGDGAAFRRQQGVAIVRPEQR